MHYAFLSVCLVLLLLRFCSVRACVRVYVCACLCMFACMCVCASLSVCVLGRKEWSQYVGDLIEHNLSFQSEGVLPCNFHQFDRTLWLSQVIRDLVVGGSTYCTYTSSCEIPKVSCDTFLFRFLFVSFFGSVVALLLLLSLFFLFFFFLLTKYCNLC